MNRHGSIDLPWRGEDRTFRLALGEIEQVESRLDASIFSVAERLIARLPATYADVDAVLELGLAGGQMSSLAARRLVEDRSRQSVLEDLEAARAVALAGLARVHGPERERDAENPERHERLDFKAIMAGAALMNVADPLSLSLGQWGAICEGWNKAHSGEKVDPPTSDEFEAAVAAARA